MEKSTQMGTNRTGIDASPFDSKSMIEGAEKFFSTGGSSQAVRSMKRDFPVKPAPWALFRSRALPRECSSPP